ncbi:uncharacterized protein LOC131150977 [Malania oleifera]|uniref:uncharacterized protein LOC131150977 n=1 Tax=Malania oleifera TaxID=397392 RepID=UPI0025AE6A9C|nr:uncharacterized protein LOC131150977 [Malania oleifera]
MAATFQQFMASQNATKTHNSQAISEIRGTLRKMMTTLNTLEKGKFPAQTQPNPQVYKKSQVHSVENEDVKPVKVVITLRSGKQTEHVVPRPLAENDSKLDQFLEVLEDVFESPKAHVDQGGDQQKEIEPLGQEIEELRKEYVPAALYPQRLLLATKSKQQKEILEAFKKVKINITVLEVIQHFPSYAKFLKELCTVKRQLNVKKKAFLVEQVSAIIQRETPPKYRDSGSPTISIMIGESRIARALLDLGNSVNLLSYSLYEQLGLGELKATTLMLQLANRSIKRPRGVMEDVLVKVDRFYYQVGFVILDMQQSNGNNSQAPVILGRPFLATSNTLIDCRSGVLKLTFGNMGLELNVFNACKMPSHFDDTSDLNSVEVLTPAEINYFSTPLEAQVVGAKWLPQFETPPPPDILKSSEEEVRQLELKSLPRDLKYVFLDPKEGTFPVVISSKLNHKDKAQLLEVLRKHRGVMGGH